MKYKVVTILDRRIEKLEALLIERTYTPQAELILQSKIGEAKEIKSLILKSI